MGLHGISSSNGGLTGCSLRRLLQMEGVRGIFSASQTQVGSNCTVSEEGQHMHQHQHHFSNAAGHMRKDETVFADKEVHTVGQVIALVVADTEVQVQPPYPEPSLQHLVPSECLLCVAGWM